MHVVDLEFARVSEVTARELVHAVGIYVIWDDRVPGQPVYIGEGNVLKRLADHASADRIRPEWDGYIALTGYCDGDEAKLDAEIGEALLLEIATDTNRRPIENKSRGKLNKLGVLFAEHGVIKMHVRGCDPLLRPGQGYNRGTKTAALRPPRRHEACATLEHNWRSRRCCR